MSKSRFNKYFDQKFDTASKAEFEDWFTMLAERVWGDILKRSKLVAHTGTRNAMDGVFRLEQFFNVMALNHLQLSQRLLREK
jgi:hypothetical protein